MTMASQPRQVIDLSEDDFEISVQPRPAVRERATPVHDASVDFSAFVSQVLEIIPDVDPEHALKLVQSHHPLHQNKVVEIVLHALFEDPSYPKQDRKGKRKRIEPEGEEDLRPKTTKVDYGSTARKTPAGPEYFELAMISLQTAHPYVPKPHIRKRFVEHNSLYAPTFMFLEQEAKSKPLPYTKKTTAYRPPGGSKGKTKQYMSFEFEEEQNWLQLRAHDLQFKDDAVVAAQVNTDEYENHDAGIECGCCFDKLPFEQMIQCNEGHLFCTECMKGFAETKLGSHDASIVCMDQSGCKEVFPPSELKRFLSDKLYALYERVKQRKEIEAAGLEDIEECPFCDWKCVIDNPEEKLFRCGNEESCGAVSCRSCKKPDHLPKSCKEMEEDKKLYGLHHVEEAMTEALMRKCPRCKQSFIKETGCNKMTCPNCAALSCYNCRQLITGYDHFDQRQPGSTGSSSKPKKCLLWEPVEQRHDDEVKRAAERAREEYKRNNPDAEDQDLRVDLPRTVPQAPPVHHFQGRFMHPGLQPFNGNAPLPGFDFNFGNIPGAFGLRPGDIHQPRPPVAHPVPPIRPVPAPAARRRRQNRQARR